LYFRDTSYNSWPIVWRHPQQLCLWSRRGFASPQSALSSLLLLLNERTSVTQTPIYAEHSGISLLTVTLT